MDARSPSGGRFRRLAGLVVTAALLVVPATALAQPSSGLDGGLDGDLNELGDERQRTARELAETRSLERDTLDELQRIQERLEDAERRADELTERVALARAARREALTASTTARRHLTVVLADLAAAEELADIKRRQLEARVVAAFKYGQVSFTEAFTGVTDIADFLNSNTYIANVLAGDRELVTTVTALLADVQDRRGDAQAARADADRQARAAATAEAEVEDALADQLAVTAEIADKHQERERLFAELRDDRRALEGHLDGLDAASQRIQDQLAEIARQQAAEADQRRRAAAESSTTPPGGSASSPGTSSPGTDATTPDATADSTAPGSTTPATPPPDTAGWRRPVPGSLTSPFGPRWGRNHNGVDLAGGVGTPVAATRGGVIVTAVSGCHPTSSWGCGGGFGNYVTVVHPGGLATIYAHLAEVPVAVGATVSAGQKVGTVGNSGNSYGPHLHFEVREMGVPRDPCGYIAC